MIGWIEPKALYRLRDDELVGLKKLFYRALTSPTTDPADLSAIRTLLSAIENELARRAYQKFPSP